MAQILAASETAQAISSGPSQWWVAQADNGVLWMVSSMFGNHQFSLHYSTDKGQTWIEDEGASDGMYFVTNTCISIVGDKIWLACSTTEASSSDIAIWQGTLNAARTAITWNDVQHNLWGPTSDYIYLGGMVAHAEGSGYKVHLVSTNRWYDDSRYWRLNMASDGTYVSTETQTNWNQSGVEGTAVSQILLDPVTKDIFLLHLQNGSSPSLYFQKRAYTGATWPAGTVRLLYTCSYYSSSMASAFDGDRVVIALSDGTVNDDNPIVLERDKADTTTTTRTPPSGVNGTMGTAQGQMALTCSASKNILLVWSDSVGDITDIYKNTFNRGAGTWSGASLVRDTTPNINIRFMQFVPGTKYFFFNGDA